jgi:hypothetical protein
MLRTYLFYTEMMEEIRRGDYAPANATAFIAEFIRRVNKAQGYSDGTARILFGLAYSPKVAQPGARHETSRTASPTDKRRGTFLPAHPGRHKRAH